MNPLSFAGTLEQDKDGTWWYIHVAKHIREKLRSFEKRGIIPVKATIGNTTWDGSLLPWADGSAQISINKMIRKKEGLTLGDKVTVSITSR